MFKTKDIAVLFPVTGTSQFRKPELKGVVHFRGTYTDEVEALVETLISEYGVKKLALFYQDDAYGKGPFQAAQKILQKHGITKLIELPYTRAAVDFSKQATKIKQEQPEAIGFFSTAQATQELIRQTGIETLANKKLFGISFLGEESFRRFIKKKGLSVLFGAVVPNPRTSTLPIVQEYRNIMDKNNYPYDLFSLEAYITTSILVEISKDIEPPITAQKILKKLESLHHYPYKGLTLTFDPYTRSLARYIWLETGNEEEWMKKEITHKQ